MGKPKTRKSITKRFKITKNKKVLFRPMHQDHFNASDSGDETRKKRKKKLIDKTIKNKIIQQANLK